MLDLRTILAVAVGAAIGGVGRLLISQLTVARAGPAAAPWATVFINVSGSFLIGVVLEATTRSGAHPLWRYFLATGILGGYTTFSTFSLDTALLYERGEVGLAALYVVLSVVMGLVGLFAGLAIVRSLA